MIRCECQATIASWADATFGECTSALRVAARANEEMAELLRAAASGLPRDRLLEEAADVVIVLYRLAEVLGADLEPEIDRKMAINRQRVWSRDGSGHGYHVREKGGS